MQSFGQTLADVMQRRYIAAIDIARELAINPALVARWARDEAHPSANDAALLAGLIGGQDGARLDQAAAHLTPAAADVSMPARRLLDATERAALQRLPPVFREAFGHAIERADGNISAP